MKKLFVILIIFLQYGYVQAQIFQWEDPVKVSNNPKGWTGRPTICNESNGNLYVAFNHYNLRDSKRLYFNWFDGETWQGVDTLYQHENYDVYDTKLVCDNNNILHLSVDGKFRAFRTPIPGDSGHEFRFNSDSDSGLISDSFAL